MGADAIKSKNPAKYPLNDAPQIISQQLWDDAHAKLDSRKRENTSGFDIYDDRFNGMISDRKFKELSEKCEAEQDEARARLEMLQKKQRASKSTEYGVEQFIKMAEQFGTLTILDREVLNRMIESIVIGDRIKNGKENEQTIKVNCRFIGEVA